MHSFRSHFADAILLRALFYHIQNWSEMSQKKRDRDGDRNLRRSRFRPSPGGFMSLAVANDFAFPNEDIRWGSIRRMTFDLAKTGFRRIRGEIRMERCRAEKKYWRSFSFLDADPNFTSSFPHRWRSSGKRSSTSTDLRVLFLTILMALLFTYWFGYR